ncbi:MAG: hypothetical protein ABSA97_07745 [Verrucomicrobiia bacterium]
MSLIVRAPSQSIAEAEAKFRTYSNYFSHIRRYIRNKYGKSILSGIQTAFAEAKDGTNCGTRHRDVTNDRLRKILFNSWNSHVVANCSFELEETMLPVVIQWMPIQYYYSIYFAAAALAYGYHGRVAENHQSVLNTLNAYARSKKTFVAPWNFQYDGSRKPPFVNFPAGFVSSKISSLSLIEDPLDSMAMFLRTTWKDRCNDRWDEMSKAQKSARRKQGKLKGDIQVTPVSLFDCFFRLRKWVNYAEAEAMLTGPTSETDVESFAQDLKVVHAVMVHVLELHLVEMFGLSTLTPIGRDYKKTVGSRVDLRNLKSRVILNQS